MPVLDYNRHVIYAPDTRCGKRIGMDELFEMLDALHPDVDFETCDTLIDDKILDSFDIVTLISEINDTFDVTISAEDITPENFNSMEAIWDLIERLTEE